MSIIYAISDIHGYYEEMLESLNVIDLESDSTAQLLFLGDYINGGEKSCQVLYKIKELEDAYGDRIVVLMGNHDQMLLDWWGDNLAQWLEVDRDFKTLKSFFTDTQWQTIIMKLEATNNKSFEINRLLKLEMEKTHGELLRWLFSKKNNFYFETPNQIFVHAGICEVDEELWKYATEESEFTWKFPAETGSFFKDIIAGHVSTVTVSNDESYLGRVFWDNESHFFIDGETVNSGVIPVLKYDTKLKIYTSFEKNVNDQWSEYKMGKSKAK